MHAQIRPSIRLAGFAAVLAAATPSLQAAAATDDFANFESYIKLSGYTPWIDGNTAAYQKRFQTRDVGAAGVEDLHLLRDLKNSTVTLDGRALFGAEDYLLHLNVTKEGVGSFDAGYSSFRTFYDGIGGFFPLNERFFALNPEHSPPIEVVSGQSSESPSPTGLYSRFVTPTKPGRATRTRPSGPTPI